jgi:hypothetical protein
MRATWKARAVFGSALVLAALAAPSDAEAQTIINVPSAQPSYTIELEPHVLFTWLGGPFDNNLGLGIRGSLPFWRPGPIPSINDNLAIGVGIDGFFFYHGALYVPVVLQWNLFLIQQLSIFIEGGIGFTFGGYTWGNHGNGYGFGAWPLLGLGGRLHITERIALTARAEWPALSLGLSILF